MSRRAEAAGGERPRILRTEDPRWQDPDMVLVTDSKGLYDTVNNDLPGTTR